MLQYFHFFIRHQFLKRKIIKTTIFLPCYSVRIIPPTLDRAGLLHQSIFEHIVEYRETRILIKKYVVYVVCGLSGLIFILL